MRAAYNAQPTADHRAEIALLESRSVALNFVSPRVENIDIVGDFNCNVYAQRVFYIEPTTTFTLDTSLNVVLMEVIGGAASWRDR